MTRYVLPELTYDYGALEPHVSGQIMELHHGRHHKAYVDGGNKALERLEEARARGELEHIGELERTLAFNASGHALHSLFWRNLAPHAGGRPTGELAAAIERAFGSFDIFRQQLSTTAATIMGSGWALLVWEPLSAQLVVTQVHDHQSDCIQSAVPLMALDAWEHAYYLQYHSDKTQYIEAVWSLWNWQDVAARYQAARTLRG